MQWKWAVARLGRSHVRAALWRTLQNQQRFHTAKCLPHAMKNPEPLVSALRLESAPRASAVDRLAHMPHQPRGPFPEVCATLHSHGRKAARDRKSSLVRRVRRRYSVRCPTLPASARWHLSCHPEFRAARCLLAATDLPATARMREFDLPATVGMQESGPLFPPRTPLASKDQVMVTERG